MFNNARLILTLGQCQITVGSGPDIYSNISNKSSTFLLSIFLNYILKVPEFHTTNTFNTQTLSQHVCCPLTSCPLLPSLKMREQQAR